MSNTKYITLILSLISFLISFLFFTPVYEDYGSFLVNCAAQQFSDFSFLDLHYLGFIGVDSFYKFLHNNFPIYNWMGIAFIGFEFLGLCLFLISLRSIVFYNADNKFIILFFQILFALFFIDNIISLSHTRFSLLFCGISLFNLAFSYRINKRAIFFNTILFTIGMLHRPESSVGMILMVAIGYMIYDFNIMHLLKRIFFPVSLTTLMLVFLMVNWHFTDVFMEKIEPEIEYKIMDRHLIDMAQLKTEEDSIKYEAAVIGMWFDPDTLTPDFLRSLLKPGINLTKDHIINVFFHLLSQYERNLFVPCLILFFIYLSMFFDSSFIAALKIVLFQTSVFILIYMLDYNGLLVSGRHFLNLQLISLLVTSFYFFKINIKFTNDNKSIILILSCLLFLISSLILTLSNYKRNNTSLANDLNCYESIMQEIESRFSNRIIVMTMGNFYLLDHSFSFYNKVYKNNTYIMFDMFTYSLIPEYLNYLNRICNCSPLNPVEFYSWLAKHDALYIAKPFRYDLTEKYMKLVHNKELQFIYNDRINKKPCVSVTEMHSYDIRKITVKN